MEIISVDSTISLLANTEVVLWDSQINSNINYVEFASIEFDNVAIYIERRDSLGNFKLYNSLIKGTDNTLIPSTFSNILNFGSGIWNVLSYSSTPSPVNYKLGINRNVLFPYGGRIYVKNLSPTVNYNVGVLIKGESK